MLASARPGRLPAVCSSRVVSHNHKAARSRVATAQRPTAAAYRDVVMISIASQMSTLLPMVMEELSPAFLNPAPHSAKHRFGQSIVQDMFSVAD